MDGPPWKLTLVVLAVLVVLAGPLAAAGMATQGALFGVQSVDPDQVLLRVDVQEDGDAEWRVEYRVRLDSENDTAAFEDLMQDLENNESAYLADFQQRINGTVDAASNETGREMAAQNFGVSARITQLPQEYGVLTYTFTWTNFAVVDGDRLVAGDALAGFFLDEETTLAIGWPSDYQATSVAPEPTERQDNAVVWRGPLDFAEGEPRVVAEPGTGTTTDGGGDGGTTPGGDGGGVDIGIVAIVFVLVLIIGAAGFGYYRRSGLPGDGLPGPAPGGNGGNGPAAEDRAGGGPDGASGTGDDVGTGGAIAGATATEAAGADGEEPPAELLSNEERVIRFLEEHGGRVKQQEIVDGLEWTDAKTSQVLSGMASDDQIEKFRIGRENVVKLPDDESDDELEI